MRTLRTISLGVTRKSERSHSLPQSPSSESFCAEVLPGIPVGQPKSAPGWRPADSQLAIGLCAFPLAGREMENSAPAKRDVHSDAAGVNETAHYPGDSAGRTGATIAEGSTPSPLEFRRSKLRGSSLGSSEQNLRITLLSDSDSRVRSYLRPLPGLLWKPTEPCAVTREQSLSPQASDQWFLFRDSVSMNGSTTAMTLRGISLSGPLAPCVTAPLALLPKGSFPGLTTPERSWTRGRFYPLSHLGDSG